MSKAKPKYKALHQVIYGKGKAAMPNDIVTDLSEKETAELLKEGAIVEVVDGGLVEVSQPTDPLE